MPEIEFFEGRAGVSPLALEQVTRAMLAPKDEKFRSELLLFYVREQAERLARISTDERYDRYRRAAEEDILKAPDAASVSPEKLEIISLQTKFAFDELLARARDETSEPVEAAIVASWREGLRAGSVFLELLRQWSNHEPVNRKTAIAEVSGRGRGASPRGWSAKTLNNAFDGWRPVCHMWAALIDLRTQNQGFRTGRNWLVCDLAELPRFLARAEAFRDAGLSIEFSEHKGALTILSADDTWHVPARVRAKLPDDL
ncbi:hypothetical protein [Parvibaculum sp.]|uniref:hypothetical protein n=1 Tax=Parvibaculum sp. TaxID=2024848 RepID=UPI00391D1472